MNIKELHPRTNKISLVSLFHCKEGEIIALQILGHQQLNVDPLEIPALLICLGGEFVIRGENAIKVNLVQSDYFKMDPWIGYQLAALENSNLIMIR